MTSVIPPLVLGSPDDVPPAPALPPAPRGTRRRFATGRAIMALILREMATTYGRSPGGYLWAVLEPIGAIGLLSIVFSVALRSPGLGTSFALFYATGYLPFMLYASLASKIAQSIQYSRPLLAYPSVTFLDAIVARLILASLTQFMVFYVVITGIHVVFDVDSHLRFGAILMSFAMTISLGVGVGMVNCFIRWKIPFWDSLWNVLNRPLFIMSGVMILFESVPRSLQPYLWFNPLYHISGEMRRGFYATYDATYVTPVYVFAVSAVLVLLGLVLLGRYHRDILND